MSEELNLVRDLAVILISAGIFTIISKALKQPLILGYIVAGFLIGPNIDFFPGISSNEAVHQWSEIGIIFLMFGLGLEFSFKKLLKVGTSALVTAGCKFIGVFVIGYVVGMAIGWTSMESLFLAGLLSMSSTMVIIKSYDEMGLKNAPWAGMVFGTLIVEDLIAILLMVLLSTMGASHSFAGGAMLGSIVKMLFFIILWFLVGIYVIPTLLQKAKRYINDEILLIVSIGLCFGMVVFSTSVGFSSALGAFVMGSILAETVESEHIDSLVRPIKDLFGAIFFVSVGMMVSPAVIWQHLPSILIITLLVYVGHIFFAAAGVILNGKGLRNAVQTGFSLAQLGEFGFIIASVGVSLGVMRDFTYPVIIAVSVITTFTTPYMIKAADPVYRWLTAKLPPRILERLDPPDTGDNITPAESGEWKQLLRSYVTRVLLYSVILTAIAIGSRLYISPLLSRLLGWLPEFWVKFITVAATLLIMTPFLYGMAINTKGLNAPALKLLSQSKRNSLPIIGLVLLRIFLAMGFILATISSHFELAGWAVVMILLAGVLFFYIGRLFLHKYSALEDRFLANLNSRENENRRRAPVTSTISAKLSGYDVHIEALEVAAESSFAGQKLKNIPFRDESGVNIIKIQRGSINITVPGGGEVIYPHDRLLAVGTSGQIAKFRSMMQGSVQKTSSEDIDFKVSSITLGQDSYLTGKALKEINIRDYKCMVVSVLRGEELITNPKSDFHFEIGDVVWIAGDPTSLDWIK